MLENYWPRTISPVPTNAKEWNASSEFLNLPNEIFGMVFENLDLPDRASLALACKTLAVKLDSSGLLSWDAVQMARLHDHENDPVTELIKVRLGKDWFPEHLKYCCRCGKYVPRSTSHWRLTLHDEFFMKGGKLGQKYRRWLIQFSSISDETILELECWNWPRPKPQTCPRCRLLLS